MRVGQKEKQSSATQMCNYYTAFIWDVNILIPGGLGFNNALYLICITK